MSIRCRLNTDSCFLKRDFRQPEVDESMTQPAIKTGRPYGAKT